MVKKLLSFALMLCFVTIATAQVTTSALAGKVLLTDTKEAVIGASVQVVHEPSGTRYAAVTNTDGLLPTSRMHRF
jgi:hypothetical protein